MYPKVENAQQNEMNIVSNQCFILNITTYNGIWQGDNPFTESLPLIVRQLAAILILTRCLYHLLKPLHQPRIISDILGGILLGPSAFGKTVYFADLFPTKNVVIVETLAYMALVFHMFLVGLQLDLNIIGRISKKAISFTVTGLFFPFTVGIGFFHLLHAYWEQNQPQGYVVNAQGSYLWAAALAVTSFPVARGILSDLKLLNSDIGRLAMPIALVSDMGSWVLIVIIIPFCANPKNAPYIITTTVAYVLASVYTFRPFLAWIVRRTSKKNELNYNDFHLCFVLVGVLLSAFVTDVTGSHSIVGAFIFGLILPSELALVLIQRFDFFISGLMMPIFFAVSGVRVDIFKIEEWRLVFFIVLWLCAVKIISFLPISLFSDIEIKDSFALGLLMNTKGVWAILIIHNGVDRGVLQDDDYAVMMITILLMTSIVAPTVAAIYDRTNLLTGYERRTIQHANPEAELRILACIHSFCNVPGLLELLDLSQATQHSHVTVFTLQLVELTGRGSALLIVHDSHNRRFDDSAYHPDYGDRSETDQIVDAFREYESNNINISIQSLTAVSPFAEMYGDICSLAEDKQVAFLILPFHKRAKKQGNLQEINPAFRDININVLLNAPCSVGIYIDRGLEETAGSKLSNKIHRIAVAYLGGPDDNEALAYAWRMARNRGVDLTVIRLSEMDTLDQPKSKASMPSTDSYLDDECINEFRLRTVGEEHIHYEERILFKGEELAVTMIELENKFDLFIVGRREGLESPLTTLFSNMVDCPELGVIGGLLAQSDSATSSVLVVKQFFDSGNGRGIEDLAVTPSLSMYDTVLEVRSGPLLTATSPGLGTYTTQK